MLATLFIVITQFFLLSRGGIKQQVVSILLVVPFSFCRTLGQRISSFFFELFAYFLGSKYFFSSATCCPN